MSYAPAQPLSFDLTDYSPIPGNALEFRLGDFSQVCEIWRPGVGIVDFSLSSGLPASLDFEFNSICYPAAAPVEIVPACDEVRPYVPPAGVINFDFYKSYVHPVGEIDFELADCTSDNPPQPPPPWYHIPSDISPGIRIVFGDGAPIDKTLDSPWGSAIVVEPVVDIPFTDGKDVSAAIDMLWHDLGIYDVQVSAAWEDLQFIDQYVSSPWRNLKALDELCSLLYGSTSGRDNSVSAPWLNPPEKDQQRGLSYGSLPEKDGTDFIIPWGNPPPKDIYHHTLWGPKYYKEICTRDYLPPSGNTIAFDLHTPITDVGTEDHVDFWFDSLSYDERCNHREPSGWRDAYTYDPIDLVPEAQVRRYYILNNLVSVTRVSDNAPVEVGSVSISADIDSWCWSFSASPASAAALGLIDPTIAGPVEIKAEINGHEFVIWSESWSMGRKFGKTDRTSGGRSLSAALAAPVALPKTYTVDVQKNARQIAEDVLQYTGWTLDWRMTDWLVPANVFSADGKTPMQIVQTIAESGGGYVNSHVTDKVLIVKDRYPAMPWDWDTATPDIVIPDAMMTSIDGDWDPRPPFNAAFVSGAVDGGISMGLTRSGTAGDLPAPMVTDKLLTHTDVCRARGKSILAAGGNWSKMRCVLPVMTDPAVPGVLLPGTLVSVTGSDPWRGQVVSVSVAANWGRALVVRQTVELERYHGS